MNIASRSRDELPWGQSKLSALEHAAYGAIKHRLARGPVKRALRRYLARSNSVVDVQLDGVKMRCHVGDNATERMLAERGVRSGKMTNVTRITSLLEEDDVFVDIGANCGLFTLFAARKIGSRGRVLAVEPLPVMLDRLAFNVAINDLSQVTVAGCAIGDQRGELTIYSRPNQYGQSGFTAKQGDLATLVRVELLHDLLGREGIAQIAALKIDVEGSEDRALLPFFAAAPRDLWPTYVLMEVQHRRLWASDCVAQLVSQGYEVTWQDDSDALLTLAGSEPSNAAGSRSAGSQD